MGSQESVILLCHKRIKLLKNGNTAVYITVPDRNLSKKSLGPGQRRVELYA